MASISLLLRVLFLMLFLCGSSWLSANNPAQLKLNIIAINFDCSVRNEHVEGFSISASDRFRVIEQQLDYIVRPLDRDENLLVIISEPRECEEPYSYNIVTRTRALLERLGMQVYEHPYNETALSLHCLFGFRAGSGEDALTLSQINQFSITDGHFESFRERRMPMLHFISISSFNEEPEEELIVIRFHPFPDDDYRLHGMRNLVRRIKPYVDQSTPPQIIIVGEIDLNVPRLPSESEITKYKTDQDVEDLEFLSESFHCLTPSDISTYVLREGQRTQLPSAMKSNFCAAYMDIIPGLCELLENDDESHKKLLQEILQAIYQRQGVHGDEPHCSHQDSGLCFRPIETLTAGDIRQIVRNLPDDLVLSIYRRLVDIDSIRFPFIGVRGVLYGNKQPVVQTRGWLIPNPEVIEQSYLLTQIDRCIRGISDVYSMLSGFIRRAMDRNTFFLVSDHAIMVYSLLSHSKYQSD